MTTANEPTPRFSGTDLGPALLLALETHRGQTRKGTTTPYASHVLQVAAIAMEYGADLEQTSAAILHDVLEDGGKPEAHRERIRRDFGEEVLAIVEAATDTTEEEKPPWRERKESYVARLASLPARAKLVIASDKLANVHSMLRDDVRDENLWSRFKARPVDHLWYFATCIREMRKGETTTDLLDLLEELERRVLELAEALLLGDRVTLGSECPLCGGVVRVPADPAPARGIPSPDAK